MEKRNKLVFHGLRNEMLLVLASMGCAGALLANRQDYWDITLFLIIAALTWNGLRTAFDYFCGNPVGFYLVTVEDTEKRLQRILVAATNVGLTGIFYLYILLGLPP